MDEHESVAKIQAWFAERCYELAIHPVKHGGFFAPWMPVDSRGGTAAPFTWGKSALDAAEAARSEVQREEAQRAN